MMSIFLFVYGYNVYPVGVCVYVFDGYFSLGMLRVHYDNEYENEIFVC